MLKPAIKRNDSLARVLIGTFSFVVFVVVMLLHYLKRPGVDVGFDIYILPRISAIINTLVSILLVAALVAVKKKKFLLHKQFMMSAMLLSVLFLLSYIFYHLFTEETKFGGTGVIRIVYYFILSTHIFLAAAVLPFILFTAYRGLTAEFGLHKSIARITWPIWLYVSITGVVVYLMIAPYYQ